MSIMKKVILLVAAIVLLRSGYAALQHQGQKDLSANDKEVVFEAPDSQQSSLPLDGPVADYYDPLHHASDDKEEDMKQAEADNVLRADSTPPSSSSSTSSTLRALHNSKDNQWAIVYFPYTTLSTCKTPLTVRSDITSISHHGFTSIRLHASDCNALYTVGHAASLHAMKIILGIHIDDSAPLPLQTAEEQLSDAISWASSPGSPGWSTIELIVIGEETIFNNILTAEELVAFLRQARVRLRVAGYTGPITTTEPIPTLYSHASTLCSAIDVAASNIHPFFSSSVAASNAGGYVRDALDVLDQICPHKPPALNLETGWPSRGQVNGEAVPGKLEQSVAVKGIMRYAGGRSTVIGWGDDGWKDEGELGVEGAWGCEELFEGGRMGRGLVEGGDEEDEVLEGEEEGAEEEEEGWERRDR